MASAVVALQSFRHKDPKNPPSNPEGGAPTSYYSFVTYNSGILTTDATARNRKPIPSGPPVTHVILLLGNLPSGAGRGLKRKCSEKPTQDPPSKPEDGAPGTRPPQSAEKANA